MTFRLARVFSAPLLVVALCAQADDPAAAERVRGLMSEARYDEAAPLIRAELERGAGDAGERCGMLDALQNAQRRLGDPFAARAPLERVAAQTGAPRAAALVDLARLDLADGALDAAAQRLDLYDRLDDADAARAADALLLRARLHVLRDEPAAAREAFAAALKKGAPVDAAAVELDAYPALREPKALAAIVAAVSKRERADAASLHAAAIAYALAGREAQALRSARAAAFAAQSADDAVLAFHADALLGRLLARSDPDAARAAYEAAIASFDRDRVALLSDASLDPRGVRASVGAPFLGLADLLLARAAKADAEEAQALRLRAIAVLEDYKRAELQEYFLASCGAAPSDPRRTLAALASGTVLAYPIVLPDRVELLVAHAGAIDQHTVRDARALREAATAFRTAVQQPGAVDFAAPGRVLSDALLAPLLALSPARVIVVPDGWLRVVPFAALPAGSGYAIEQVAIVEAPALVAAEPSAAAPRGTLVAGLAAGVQGYPALPGVRAEVDRVKSSLDVANDAVLVDTAYRLEAVRGGLRARAPSVLHFATHGEIGRRSNQSFLLTYDDRIYLNQLDELVRGGGGLDLITLSACQTASGDDRAALGLGGIALQAGSQHVLASLWSVSDAATAELIPAFYRGYAASRADAASALRAAQLELLRSERWSHPAYWAPFVLIERVPVGAEAKLARDER